MSQQELIPHLFRTEFQKIVAVLCRQYGLENIEMAEDIAGETFLSALEIWPYQGLPQNPVAWLYTVAKNKLKNSLTRQKIYNEKVRPNAKNEITDDQKENFDWTEASFNDSQLKMLFALSHPSLSEEAQIALSLRILCGFGIEEIATAFLTNKETINKRLYRAKELLRQNSISLELPCPAEITNRLDAVLKTLYLLFSEGYYSESSDTQIRKDLCFEAMRLTQLLLENTLTNTPPVNALFALMCFHASRFDARTGGTGEIILYHEQDEAKWNRELILKGAEYLHRAAQGDTFTTYHLEASIAYWHTIKGDTKEKWEAILQLYNHLLTLQYSPIAALNRTYALAKVKGAEVAVREAEKLDLKSNRFYHALLGELYSELDIERSTHHFMKAVSLTKSPVEQNALENRLLHLRQQINN